MKPRRQRPVRTRIRFSVEIRSPRSSFDAEARDLSVDGLCLSSPILLMIGDRAGTTFRLGGAELSLSFEVRWARPDGEHRYLLGVEFVHTAESRKSLQKLMWQVDSGAVRGSGPSQPPPAPLPAPSALPNGRAAGYGPGGRRGI